MHHRPRKRFGQNFLQDTHTIQSIIQAIAPQKNDLMLEIGPGLGAITQPLLKALDNLIAVEIDKDLYPHLQGLPHAERLSLISADALNVDFSQWGNPLRVVGNLPYNISTPLLFHLLEYRDCLHDMHFMLQKEVVDRIVAAPGSKAYGRLSIMIQLHCNVECLFLVPPEAFYPIPKVESAIIRMTPRVKNKYPPVDGPLFQKLITCAFSMRRKTLANNLKSLINADALHQLTIDPNRRPEQISIEEYINIAHFISE